jgi:hypothetical protein
VLLFVLTVPIFEKSATTESAEFLVNFDKFDRFFKPWCTPDTYSASSAYKAMFYGQSQLLRAKQLWSSRALTEFKFHFWLALQDWCLDLGSPALSWALE